jgi:hypothetical protein
MAIKKRGRKEILDLEESEGGEDRSRSVNGLSLPPDN